MLSSPSKTYNYNCLPTFLNPGPAPAIDHLGIKPYQWGTECLSGDVKAGDATSFPQALGMVSYLMHDI